MIRGKGRGCLSSSNGRGCREGSRPILVLGYHSKGTAIETTLAADDGRTMEARALKLTPTKAFKALTTVSPPSRHQTLDLEPSFLTSWQRLLGAPWRASLYPEPSVHSRPNSDPPREAHTIPYNYC
jgi:hypothetical protein